MRTAESSRLGRRHRHAMHACHRPADACHHGCYCYPPNIENQEDCELAPHQDDIAPPVVSVAPAAPVVSAAPAVTVAAEAAFTGVGSGGSGEPLSQAAVEAWEAAETWATVLAAVTGAVAARGEDSTSVGAEESTAGTRKARGKAHPAGTTVTTRGPDPEHHRRQKIDEVFAEGRAGRGDSCFLSERNNALATGFCRNALRRRDSVLLHSSPLGLGDFCRSAVHRRDSILCSSSSSSSGGSKIPAGAAGRFVGCGCPAAVQSRTSTDPRRSPIPTSAQGDGVLGTARRRFSSSGSRDGWKAPSETAGRPATFRPEPLAGAAAATVLARIERGDIFWSRRALGTGLAALRAHRTTARARKARHAVTARHCVAALCARGMRAMEARVKLRTARREAAAAAATTGGAFSRARQIRAGVAMLKRNRQARTALRSRDDLADLHFAEWRVPCAVQDWRDRAQASRSCHERNAIAASIWRSKALRISLDRWIRNSLGDQEKRQRLLAWRDALSTHAPDPPCAASDLNTACANPIGDGASVKLQKIEAGVRQVSQGRGNSHLNAFNGAPAMRIAVPPTPMPQQPAPGPELVAASPVGGAAGGTLTRLVVPPRGRKTPVGEDGDQVVTLSLEAANSREDHPSGTYVEFEEACSPPVYSAASPADVPPMLDVPVPVGSGIVPGNPGAEGRATSAAGPVDIIVPAVQTREGEDACQAGLVEGSGEQNGGLNENMISAGEARRRFPGDWSRARWMTGESSPQSLTNRNREGRRREGCCGENLEVTGSDKTLVPGRRDLLTVQRVDATATTAVLEKLNVPVISCAGRREADGAGGCCGSGEQHQHQHQQEGVELERDVVLEPVSFPGTLTTAERAVRMAEARVIATYADHASVLTSNDHYTPGGSNSSGRWSRDHEERAAARKANGIVVTGGERHEAGEYSFDGEERGGRTTETVEKGISSRSSSVQSAEADGAERCRGEGQEEEQQQEDEGEGGHKEGLGHAKWEEPGGVSRTFAVLDRAESFPFAESPGSSESKDRDSSTSRKQEVPRTSLGAALASAGEDTSSESTDRGCSDSQANSCDGGSSSSPLLPRCPVTVVVNRPPPPMAGGGEATVTSSDTKTKKGRVKWTAAPIIGAPSWCSGSLMSARGDVGGGADATRQHLVPPMPTAAASAAAAAATRIYRDESQETERGEAGPCANEEGVCCSLEEPQSLSGGTGEHRGGAAKERTQSNARYRDGPADGDGNESLPLSWVSASRLDDLRLFQTCDLNRTLSGSWVLAAKLGEGIEASLHGARNDGGAPGVSPSTRLPPRDLEGPRTVEACMTCFDVVAKSPARAEQSIPSSISGNDEATEASDRRASLQEQTSGDNGTLPPRGLVPKESLPMCVSGAVDGGTVGGVVRSAGFWTAPGSNSSFGGRQCTVSEEPRSMRMLSSGSAPPEFGEELKASDVFRRRSFVDHQQMVSPWLSLGDVGQSEDVEGSMPLMGPIDAAAASAEDPRQPRHRSVAVAAHQSALPTSDEGRGSTAGRAGTVLTCHPRQQAASSDLSCVSWSDRDDAAGADATGGSDGSEERCGSDRSQNSSQVSAVRRPLGGDSDGGSHSSSRRRQRSRPGDRSVDMSDCSCARRAARAAAVDGVRTGIGVRLGAPPIGGLGKRASDRSTSSRAGSAARDAGHALSISGSGGCDRDSTPRSTGRRRKNGTRGETSNSSTKASSESSERGVVRGEGGRGSGSGGRGRRNGDGLNKSMCASASASSCVRGRRTSPHGTSDVSSSKASSGGSATTRAKCGAPGAHRRNASIDVRLDVRLDEPAIGRRDVRAGGCKASWSPSGAAGSEVPTSSVVRLVADHAGGCGRSTGCTGSSSTSKKIGSSSSSSGSSSRGSSSRGSSSRGSKKKTADGGGGVGRGGRRDRSRERRAGYLDLMSGSTGCPDSQGSSSQRRERLEERLSEVFLRRRRVESAFRKWRTRFAASRARRSAGIPLLAAAAAIAFSKGAALTKWRAAHKTLLSRKAAAADRQSRLLRKTIRVYGEPACSQTSVTTAAVAVAIMAVRSWHRRSTARLLLRRTLEAWSGRAQASREVTRHRRRALAEHGLATWRRAARKAGWARGRSIAAALFMSQATGRRRLRAWLNRRRRRADAMRIAEDHYARAAVTPAAARWRRQRRRDERLRMEAAWRSWRRTAGEKRASRSERKAIVTAVQSRLRRGAVEAWRGFARERRRRRCSLTDVSQGRARRLGREGLRGLQGGALNARERRCSLGAGEGHWRRRASAIFTSRLRKLLESKKRLLRRAAALRLRANARVGLGRWRKFARSARKARAAFLAGDGWWQERTKRAGFSALRRNLARRVSQDRSMCAGRLHFSLITASVAFAAWRVRIRRQAAAGELHEAATALHRSWMASAGLRSLDRAARARMARREAADIAERYLLRNHGLLRWRAMVMSLRHSRGKSEAATTHWAKTLATKVFISWEAAAVQQWAEARQEEAAARHERLMRKKRAIRGWKAMLPGRMTAAMGTHSGTTLTTPNKGKINGQGVKWGREGWES